jgi:hypothetical protein
MKKTLLTCLILFSFTNITYAQSYQWTTGGGSTEAMTPSQNYERVTNICTDEDGNVYITALTGATSIVADTFSLAHAFNTSASIPHILLASYRCDGAMRWAKLIESAEGAVAGGADYSNGGLAYSNGSLYLVGNLYGDNKHIGHDTTITSTYLESFTARFDTLGNFKWIRFVGTDVPSNEVVTGFGDNSAVAIDGQGYIHYFNFVDSGAHLTSTLTAHTGTYDLKYDSTGTLLSENKVQIDSTWSLIKAIFNKQDGKFYALLWLNQIYSLSAFNTAIGAFLPDESMIWMDTSGSVGTMYGFDYKGTNAIYVCGEGNYPDTLSFGGISVTDTIFPMFQMAVVYRLDTNGIARWAYNLQSNESVDAFSDITILSNEKIAAIGYGGALGIHGTDTIITPPDEYSNPFLLIADTSGNTLKLDQAHGDGYDYGYVVTSDTIGNIYSGGEVADSLGATGLGAYHSHGGNTDFYLLKYGVDCSCTTTPIASYTDTGTHTIGLTYTGTTTGIDSVVWSYGDGSRGTGLTALHTYSVAGVYNACVTVYTTCGSDESCHTVTVIIGPTGIQAPSGPGSIVVYPNPAKDELEISGVATDMNYKISNIAGIVLQSGALQKGENAISVHNFNPGIYFLEMMAPGGERMEVKVVKD